MSKGTIIALVVGALVILWGISARNGMATSEVEVDAAWSNVQTAYQRRADLIPNLVKTVQGAANFEKSTLTDVINARAGATQIKLDAKDLTPENLAKYEAAQEQLKGSLSRLMMVAENYPQLKASEQFSELQAQLEGTENRIKGERDNFNQAVKAYNNTIVTFPGSLIAGFSGFTKKAFFQATAAAQEAPVVDFSK